ncbi:type II toxin-antitoxin system VapC family toxin [Argonema galeatum]|uniref:type II toxin-antitoxin system VapC family toxin n=1 Tax=Argonema galeatum TaxID=2942762 RepID=UPI00201288CE|nr:type II toxin-antitoxin system VapC family toxin [Argonema galeatum]MCL1465416.1 type II toxin-antitoxin system VapC family toxin [Argonema galeatum A003/A1]
MTAIYLLDTNVLLRFADRNHPLHTTIRAAIRKLRDEGHQLQIAPQNCVEFWNVGTRPIDRNGFGLTPNDADRLLRLIERLFPLLVDVPEIYIEWRRLVVAFGVSGVQVHDARLVAAMKANKISHILTLNTADFARYANEGIVAVDPRSHTRQN